ncbi:hypothetical protein [Patiriisocius sp. Uisw_017]|uniref:hypothetical protein n=1 Tax=Patiriisocius sp. Uisw_017 TaxID=3230968 RepID=UPI0039E95929
MKYYILISAMSFLILSSCSSPKLSKRYKSSDNVWIANNVVQDYVTVNTKSYKTFPKKEELKKDVVKKDDDYKTIFDLSKNAQSEILKKVKLENKVMTISSLTEELNVKPKNGSTQSTPTGGIVTYQTKFQNNLINKNIVFSVSRVFSSSGEKFKTINKVGDRIQYLDLSLAISNSDKLKFMNWNKFENDYAIADFGSITSSKSISADISIGYEATANLDATNTTDTQNDSGGINTTVSDLSNTSVKDGEGYSNTNSQSNSNTETLNYTLKKLNNTVDKLTEFSKIAPSAKLSATDKLDEQRQFKAQILKLSGILNDNGFEIKQEGFEGINLKGNTSINVDLKFEGQYDEPITFLKFSNFYKTDKTGSKPNTYKKLNVVYTNLFYPKLTEDIKAKVGYRYLYRSIRGGDKFIPEYKHKVKYLFGEIPNGDVKSEEFILIKKSDFHPIVFQVNNNGKALKLNGLVLNFEKKEHAIEFVSWLIFSNDSVFYKTNLNIQDLTNLKIIEKEF